MINPNNITLIPYPYGIACVPSSTIAEGHRAGHRAGQGSVRAHVGRVWKEAQPAEHPAVLPVAV